MALIGSNPTSSCTWRKRAIYSSAIFGGISYAILAKSKKDVAEAFTQNVREAMSSSSVADLLTLYEIHEDDTDSDTLQKTCQFESDIGFFTASLAQVQGSPAHDRTYMQILDLKNPFDDSGALPKNEFATHMWDLVAWLGCYDDLLDKKPWDVIRLRRDRILNFGCGEEDTDLWPVWAEQDSCKAVRVTNEGLKVRSMVNAWMARMDVGGRNCWRSWRRRAKRNGIS